MMGLHKQHFWLHCDSRRRGQRCSPAPLLCQRRLLLLHHAQPLFLMLTTMSYLGECLFTGSQRRMSAPLSRGHLYLHLHLHLHLHLYLYLYLHQ